MGDGSVETPYRCSQSSFQPSEAADTPIPPAPLLLERLPLRERGALGMGTLLPVPPRPVLLLVLASSAAADAGAEGAAASAAGAEGEEADITTHGRCWRRRPAARGYRRASAVVWVELGHPAAQPDEVRTD